MPAPHIVDIQEFGDAARGSLFVAACGAHIPFPVQRIFFMPDLPQGAHRGGHAHRRCQQFLICLAGAVEIAAFWPGGEAAFALDTPRHGLHLPPLSWVDIRVVLPSSSCLVLASDLYDPADYVHDRAEFETLRAATCGATAASCSD